jgi:hypothetical protein
MILGEFTKKGDSNVTSSRLRVRQSPGVAVRFVVKGRKEVPCCGCGVLSFVALGSESFLKQNLRRQSKRHRVRFQCPPKIVMGIARRCLSLVRLF